MTEEEVKLFILEKTEEIIEKRSGRSFWRSAFATVLILPLLYFAISALAERAAEASASEALECQRAAWTSVYSKISNDAIVFARSAEAARRVS